MAPRRPRPHRFSRTNQPARYGGAAGLKGSDNFASKLTEKSVKAARQAHRKGVSLTLLAKRYKVSLSTMSRAVRKLTFRHVR
ncbi:MAG: hypothetical protein ABJD11_15580 [Gemmatimonadota bacterium]